MTPDELKKEAERIVMIWHAVGFSDEREGLECLIANVAGKLLAAHEAGFKDAKEKAEYTVRQKLPLFIPNSGAANVICECVEEIRALKIGGGK